MYKRIIVPLDGSEAAELALPHAEALAQQFGASMHLIRVLDISHTSSTPYGAYLAIEAGGLAEVLEQERQIATEYLEKIQKRADLNGYEVTMSTPQGSAVNEIVQSANKEDVIVMATHGRGGVARWFMGSVAEDVVRKSTVPVLLVRAGKQEAKSLESNQPAIVGASPEYR